MRFSAAIHKLISVSIAAAIPVAVYVVKGAAGWEFIVLGATVGFAYWYWGPTWPPL
jgi:hypothetical protein